MKVLYDFQIFTLQKYGGISRYYYHLIDELKKSNLAEISLGLKYSQNAYLKESDWAGDIQVPQQNNSYDKFMFGLNFKGKGRLYNLFSKVSGNTDIYGENKAETIRLLKEGNFDVFHPTYHHDVYFLKHLGNKKLVVTIYDMAHEIFPEFFSLNDPVFANKKLLVERADRIIAISENTKQDIIKFYGVDPARIDIVYLSSPFSGIPEKMNIDLPEQYILFVGNRNVYKNFYFFAQGAAQVMHKNKGLNLFCLGGGQFSVEEKQYFEMLEIGDRVTNLSDFDSATQAYIYKQAAVSVYPSQYEGFGIPILEAWACDCPLILANSSCLPEVAADAAEYFEPKDIVSLTTALEKVIGNKQLQADLVKKGQERLKLFSASKVAEDTIEVYKKALNH